MGFGEVDGEQAVPALVDLDSLRIRAYLWGLRVQKSKSQPLHDTKANLQIAIFVVLGDVVYPDRRRQITICRPVFGVSYHGPGPPPLAYVLLFCPFVFGTFPRLYREGK